MSAVRVPERTLAPGLAPRAIVTATLAVVTVAPDAASSFTWTAGVIAEVAAVLEGCTVYTSCVAVRTTTEPLGALVAVHDR